jgi:hypothetical protein
MIITQIVTPKSTEWINLIAGSQLRRTLLYRADYSIDNTATAIELWMYALKDHADLVSWAQTQNHE